MNFNHLFDQFAPYENNPVIAIAVSGGADSMALCLLTNDWVKSVSGKVIALTIDHDLRPESQDEAKQVKQWLNIRGIEHYTIKWQHEKLLGNIQSQAREARYRLLSDWCNHHDILHLMLGHHMGDQVETMLMRFTAGASVSGMAGMPKINYFQYVRILRPLLNVSKELLCNYLNSLNQSWIEDSSNYNHKFDRIYIRENLLKQAKLSDTKFESRMNDNAQNFARAKVCLEQFCYQAMARIVKISPLGYAAIILNEFSHLNQELSLMILARTLTVIGGNIDAPRFKSLKTLHQNILTLQKKMTLAGCIIAIKNNNIIIYREIVKAKSQQSCSKRLLWDNRFLITFDNYKPDLNWRLDFLGETGWKQIKSKCEKTTINIPKSILFTLPAIWHLDKVVYLPYIEHSRYKNLSNQIICKFQPLRRLSDALFSYN